MYKDFLRRVDFFKNLEDEDIEKVIASCREDHFAEKEVIFSEGDPADRFYIVLKGVVEVWKDWGTEEQDLLAVHKEGSFFGEMALIDDLPRSATVIAAKPTKVLYQSQGDFQKLIQSNSSIAISIMKSVSSMVRKSNETFVEGLRIRNQQLETALKDLKAAQEDLVRSERLSTMGKFSSSIIHDLRNPISIVKGYTEILQMKLSKESKEQVYLNNIIGEIDRVNRLCNELLDFSRGEIRLNYSLIDMKNFFDKILPLVKSRDPQNKIEIKVDSQIVEPVLFDEDRMLRVVLNLADNARKAMRKGGVLKLGAVMELERLVIEVSDDGEGMSPEVQEKIFDPFYSGSKAGGTGLGMMVVKNVVEAHGGMLSVNSSVGVGSTIKIIIPTK